MRIRKNAKISQLLYAATAAASSLKPVTFFESHVCQLNQSPWDVMNFSPPSSPPPTSQVNKTATSWIDDSPMDSISILEREEFNDVGETWDFHDGDSAPDTAAPEGLTILCCKTDGKQWQCRKEVAAGSSMCQRHLSMTRSYSRSSTKKPADAAQRRPRPKKTSGSTSSNPYEFYYYSGFGPRWGKKRGGGVSGSEIAKSLEHDQEMEPSPSSHIVDYDFDGIEYEDDEEDEEEGINGKKRARKPIKARSLKSLM